MRTRTDKDKDIDFGLPLSIESGFFRQPPPLAAPRSNGMSRNTKIGIAAFVIALVASVSAVAIALTLEAEDPVEAAKWRTIRDVTAKLAVLKANMAAEAENGAAAPEPVEPAPEEPATSVAAADPVAEPAAVETARPSVEKRPVKRPVEKKPVVGEPVEKKPVEKKPDQTAPQPRDELDVLINPGVSSKKPTGLPRTLSRDQVQAGMSRVAGAVRSCGDGQGGNLTVWVTISGNGKVSSASVIGSHASTPVGACAVRHVRRATFPAFADPSLRVKYPFAL